MDTTPLYYDLFPRSIIDLTECVQLIDQLHVFGYQNVGLLFDRGYFSEPNVRELDAHGFEFIMMLRDDQNFVKKLIKAHVSMLRDNPDAYISGMEVFGITVEKMLYDKNRNFHIYYDEMKAGYAKRRFLNSLAALKSELLELKGKVLRKNANLTKYRPWFNLDVDKEKHMLKSYKKLTGNKKSYAVPAMIDQLEQIECTAFENGIYQRRYAFTAKQKLILEALNIDTSVIGCRDRKI